MTSKEAVLAVWPDVIVYYNRVTASWFWYRKSDPDSTSAVCETEEAAWQNAAESLPPEPAQEVCPYCRDTKDKCLDNEYCYSTHWKPVEPLPVKAKEKKVQHPIPCPTCKAPVFVRENGNIIAHYNGDGDRCAANETQMPCDCWKHEQTVCDICQGVAEPKPTPYTEKPLETLARLLHEGGAIPVINGVRIEQKRPVCPTCAGSGLRDYIRVEADPAPYLMLKPQPDSSSISTEPIVLHQEKRLTQVFACGKAFNTEQTFSCAEIDEFCCEWGSPEYVMTDDGEAWYWRFSGHDLPVADNLSELFMAAQQLAKGQR